MSIIESIKYKWNTYNNSPLINNYEYLSEKDIKKIEEELLEVYSFNSSINYTNPSYIFPHQFLLDKSDALNNTHNKYQNAWYYIFHIYNTYKTIIFLKEDLEKTNEKLSIHFDFLSKLKKLHPETKTIIEQEQIKIKEYFKINQSAIATIKKFIKKNKIFYKEKNIDVADIEYEKLKQIVIYFLNDNKIIEEVENDYSNNKYIGLKYKLDVFFNSEKGSLYKSNIINEINNIENNFKNNSNYNPIPEINNIIKKYQFIKKHHMQYQMNMESPSNEYVRILRVKYEYLKKHPIEEEIVQLRNDYQAISIYAKFIQNDLDEINIKDEVDNYFYENIENYKDKDILYNNYLFTLTLFFAYYSDTIDKWFQNSMINENINIKKINLNDNNIKYKQDISRETFIYFLDPDIDLIKLHQEVLKKKKLSWELFKGIEKITLTNTEECNKLVSYLSLSDNITISKDVKSFTLENLKDIESGNITFQEGIEDINIRNVSFKDDIIITIPKSVTSLKLDYNYGINSTLVFEEYDQSILNNKKFIKELVNEYYTKSSNIKYNDLEQLIEVDIDIKKINKIIGKRNNEIIEYSFHPIIINNCSSKLSRIYLINKARKIVYEEICKIFIKTDKLLSNTSSEEEYYSFFTSDDNNMEKSNIEYNSKNKKYIYQRKRE